jgi:secreted PhoX family phosphatase
MTRKIAPELPRRAVLTGGLGMFAALIASRSLAACSDPEAASPAPAPGPTPPEGPAVLGGDEFPFAPNVRPKLASNLGSVGELGAADASGVRVPPGFSARVVARTGEPPVPGKPYEWHIFPDGGATYSTPDGGWIYVSNSEFPLSGGVGALRFDAQGALVDAYPVLQKTNVNCAGGPTPWGTWLSCEEIDRGQVYECDPRGEIAAVHRPALGTFKHEAAAIDPITHHVYLTEDEPDGAFYRFVPDGTNKHGFSNLASGALEVAVVAGDGKVTWRRLPDPLWEGPAPTRRQIPQSTVFSGGEGIWWHERVVYLSTKGDDRVWAYDTQTETIRVLYDAKAVTAPVLTGVDNLTVTCCGDVLVAEDAGDMQIVAILPSGELKPLVQVLNQEKSEITGPAFDPSGTRLYFSSQRGGSGGITYEVIGPFHLPG